MYLLTSYFTAQITTPKMYWTWLYTILLPNLYSGAWWNGRELTWRESLQIDDRVTVRVGVPRLRLQRIKDGKKFAFLFCVREKTDT